MTDTDTAPDAQARARERLFFFGALAFYLALGLWKMRAYLAEGRFWAEEGSVFFTQMHALGPLQQLFFLYYGHLELPTNIVIALATLVPLQLAPLVTSHLSFALQSIPVILLLVLRRELGLPGWGVAALLVILAGLPQAHEVWATSINLHFHFSLVVALVAAASTDGPIRRHAFRALLLLSGLSGIPANFLAPVFLALAVKTKDRERWVQFSIIAATALLQLVLLFANSSATGPRDVALDPRLYWLPIVSQMVLSPLFGAEVTDKLAEILRLVLANRFHAWLFALACSVPIYLFFRAAFAGPSRLAVLASSAALLPVLSIIGSIGDKTSLISAAGGGRYFFAANVLVVTVVIVLAAGSTSRALRALVVLMVVSAIVRVPDYIGGPPWRAAYERARNSGAPQIEIWPAPWTMRNVERASPQK